MALSLAREVKPIWTEKTVCADILHWTRSETKTITIQWDPAKTKISYAGFRFRVHGSVPWFIPFPSMEGVLIFNGVEVGKGGWAPWTSCTSYEGEVNVTGLLRNGDNLLEAVAKGYFLSPGVTCCFTVSAELLLEWEGAKPKVETPEERMWRYITYGAIGAAVMGGLALTITLVKRRK